MVKDSGYHRCPHATIEDTSVCSEALMVETVEITGDGDTMTTVYGEPETKLNPGQP